MGDAINSGQLDYCPFIDVENGILYFTNERYSLGKASLTVEGLKKAGQIKANGFGDIYRIPLETAFG